MKELELLSNVQTYIFPFYVMGHKGQKRIAIPQEELEKAKFTTIEQHIEHLMDEDLREFLAQDPALLHLLVSIQCMRNLNRIRNMYLGMS